MPNGANEALTGVFTPTHQDAVGYLNDLTKEIDEPWFTMVCDLAIMSSVSNLDEATRDTLFALYTKKASYVGIIPVTSAPATVVSATPADFLEQLSEFANFKLLSETLELNFNRRITLIFGPNGSGKSSLCESLKALAAPEPRGRSLDSDGNEVWQYRQNGKSGQGVKRFSDIMSFGMTASTDAQYQDILTVSFKDGAVTKATYEENVNTAAQVLGGK